MAMPPKDCQYKLFWADSVEEHEVSLILSMNDGGRPALTLELFLQKTLFHIIQWNRAEKEISEQKLQSTNKFAMDEFQPTGNTKKGARNRGAVKNPEVSEPTCLPVLI